jgi:hypothetical protein
MRLSPRLKEDSLETRRKSAGKLFQASIFLQKIPGSSLLDALMASVKLDYCSTSYEVGSK